MSTKKPDRNAPCPCGSGKKFKHCHLTPKFNKRFNRWETAFSHQYNNLFGTEPRGTSTHVGLVKCKLFHGPGASVIVPDVIFLGLEGKQWIQPLAFHAPLLMKSENEIWCRIHVDISGGQQIVVAFKASDYLTRFDDGSELFKCELQGPFNLMDHATGKSWLEDGTQPVLELFHHTKAESKDSILKGGYFRPSFYNIQGNKTLVNTGYTYFTPLDRIVHDEDLKRIAMASDGKIHLMVDGFEPPKVLFPGWEDRYKNFILVLGVYRQSTLDRRHTITLGVDAAALAPSHLLMHTNQSLSRYYEIASPFIHRVGMYSETQLGITNLRIRADNPAVKRFKHIVVGDATTLDGLAAPYDEENTKAIFKIEFITEGSNMLRFWMDNSNQDHFTGKTIQFDEFRAVK